jgi:hypothetical protein
MRPALLATPFVFLFSSILAAPANTNINPAAVTGTICGNANVYVSLLPSLPLHCPSVPPLTHLSAIDFHDFNVAQLSICGGIAGSITKCLGNPSSTVGASGTAKFSLKATVAGSTINVSKGRWEGCVRAARAVCPSGEFTSTCVGGATPAGDVAFSLVGQ